MDIKELIKKQRQKMFENRLKKIVEDFKRWASKKTSIEVENEKLKIGAEMKANKNIVIGVDVGFEGGIAVYDIQYNNLAPWEMPVIKKNDKRELNIDRLIDIFYTVADGVIMCGIEFQHPFPKEGVKSVFSLGKQVGILEAVLTSACIPYEFINPPEWKKFFMLKGKDKKGAIEECANLIEILFPYLPIKTKEGKYKTGIIDSVLIMLYTLLKYKPDCIKALETKGILTMKGQESGIDVRKYLGVKKIYDKEVK
jgi:Holliday junction resolvasome RuvABC endonuclease subunit